MKYKFELGQRANQAQAALDTAQEQKPQAYQSQWNDQRDQLLGQIQNRKPFQYDINKDALYNQYKDQYVRQGKLAMQDTMGQAAALTGGYGSSYAQQVGQQAFQGYLAGLNDKVPQLYQQALDQYNQEGQDLYNQYNLLGNRENEDYGRYQDELTNYMNDRNYLATQAANERAFDYQLGRDETADDQWQQTFDRAGEQYDRQFGYQRERDAVGDNQWQQNFDYNQAQADRNYNYQVGRDQVADAQWDKQYQTALDQWQKNYDYQQGRDAAADQQWQQQFDYNQKQADRAFDYQAGRDQVSDAQWGKQYQTALDQWQKGYDYQAARDAVSDEQWNKQYQEALDQFLYQHPDYLTRLEAIKNGTYGQGVVYGGGGGKTSEEQVPIDSQSVAKLGYGPISADKLKALENVGAVTSNVVNGLRKFVNTAKATTTTAAQKNSSGIVAPVSGYGGSQSSPLNTVLQNIKKKK